MTIKPGGLRPATCLHMRFESGKVAGLGDAPPNDITLNDITLKARYSLGVRYLNHGSALFQHLFTTCPMQHKLPACHYYPCLPYAPLRTRGGEA
jgi:hypothetical protein